jgi:hypothetical protein
VGEGVFKSVPSPLTKSVRAAGDRLDIDYGVAFMDTKTGGVELWSPAPTFVTGETMWLQPSRDGRLLVLQRGQDPATMYVISRDSGEAFALGDGWAPDMSVGFENVIGAWHGPERMEFALLDVAHQQVLSIDIDRMEMFESSRASSPDGKSAVLGNGSEFRLVDATTGNSRKSSAKPTAQILHPTTTLRNHRAKLLPCCYSRNSSKPGHQTAARLPCRQPPPANHQAIPPNPAYVISYALFTVDLCVPSVLCALCPFALRFPSRFCIDKPAIRQAPRA